MPGTEPDTEDARPVTQPRGDGARRRRGGGCARAPARGSEERATGVTRARSEPAPGGDEGPAVSSLPGAALCSPAPPPRVRAAGGAGSSRAVTRTRGAQVPALRRDPDLAQLRGGLAPVRAPGAAGGSRAWQAPWRGGRERRGEAPAAGTGRAGRGPYSRGGGGGPVNLNDSNLACLRR